MQQTEMYKHAVRSVPALASEERPWGKWSVMHEGTGYKIKLLEVAPGRRLSLQLHRHRSEYWFVLEGNARIVLGDDSFDLAPAQSATVPVGTLHRIENPHAEWLTILEVQWGVQLLEEDIVRIEDDYNRIPDWRRNAR